VAGNDNFLARLSKNDLHSALTWSNAAEVHERMPLICPLLQTGRGGQQTLGGTRKDFSARPQRRPSVWDPISPCTPWLTKSRYFSGNPDFIGIYEFIPAVMGYTADFAPHC
jgi:hypothetical protein